MPEGKVEKLAALLQATSLNYIEVIPFQLDDPDIAPETMTNTMTMITQISIHDNMRPSAVPTVPVSYCKR